MPSTRTVLDDCSKPALLSVLVGVETELSNDLFCKEELEELYRLLCVHVRRQPWAAFVKIVVDREGLPSRLVATMW